MNCFSTVGSWGGFRAWSMFLLYENSVYYKFTLIIHIHKTRLVCTCFLYGPRFITDMWWGPSSTIHQAFLRRICTTRRGISDMGQWKYGSSQNSGLESHIIIWTGLRRSDTIHICKNKRGWTKESILKRSKRIISGLTSGSAPFITSKSIPALTHWSTWFTVWLIGATGIFYGGLKKRRRSSRHK